MSLKTKFLLHVSAFMLLILGLLTAFLVAESWVRVREERRGRAEWSAMILDPWVRREPAFQHLREGGGSWIDVRTALMASPLVREWRIGRILREESLSEGWRVGDLGGEPQNGLLGPEDQDAMLRAHRDTQAQILFLRRETLLYLPFVNELGEPFVLKVDLALSAGGSPLLPSVSALFWIMGLATVLVLIVVYVLLQRFVLRPLESLVEASQRVGRGDFTRPVPERMGVDEMSQLVSSFNHMMGRIAAYQRDAEERVHHTEHRLRVHQRLSATGALAAGIAHEINNPLGGMLNAALALREGHVDESSREAYLGLIIEGLDRVQKIVGQVLRLSPRPYNQKKLRVDVRESVRGILSLVAHKAQKKGVEVVLRAEGEVPAVLAEPSELQQAVLNVILNAVDASPPSGGRVEIECAPLDGGVGIHVRDNGHGMSEEELNRCLEPFFTTKEVGEGTGIGLSVAHSIVMSHGGEMYIETRQGEGTKVTFWLPAAPAEEPSASAAAAGAHLGKEGG